MKFRKPFKIPDDDRDDDNGCNKNSSFSFFSSYFIKRSAEAGNCFPAGL